MPDLTELRSDERVGKLQVEVAEGVYTASSHTQQEELTRLYNYRKNWHSEGLDTYWLAKPLRAGVGNKHGINLELGDSQNLRAIFDITYNQVNGVMKGSERRNISGSSNISSRRNQLLFKNITTFLSNNSTDSPYGSFNSYAMMNPYWQANNDQGNVLRWAEDNIPNPLYDATIGTQVSLPGIRNLPILYGMFISRQSGKRCYALVLPIKKSGG